MHIDWDPRWVSDGMCFVSKVTWADNAERKGISLLDVSRIRIHGCFINILKTFYCFLMRECYWKLLIFDEPLKKEIITIIIKIRHRHYTTETTVNSNLWGKWYRLLDNPFPVPNFRISAPTRYLYIELFSKIPSIFKTCSRFYRLVFIEISIW
jgi:hypothetical protein